MEAQGLRDGRKTKMFCLMAYCIVPRSRAVILCEFPYQQEPGTAWMASVQMSLARFWQSISRSALFSQEITDMHNAPISPHPPPSLHGPSSSIPTPCPAESLQSCLHLCCWPPACAVPLPQSPCPDAEPCPSPGEAAAEPAGESALRACVRGYCSALVWGLLMGVDEKMPGCGTFFMRLHAILSALHAFYLWHIYAGFLMPTYIIVGNVNAPSLSYAVG